jgi:hypothetical protein
MFREASSHVIGSRVGNEDKLRIFRCMGSVEIISNKLYDVGIR